MPAEPSKEKISGDCASLRKSYAEKRLRTKMLRLRQNLIAGGDIHDDIQEILKQRKVLDWQKCSEKLPDYIMETTNSDNLLFACLTEEGLVLPLSYSLTIRSKRRIYRWMWFDRPAPWKIIAWAPLSQEYQQF